MKVRANFHTDDLLNQAYIWSCKLILFKKAMAQTFQRAHAIEVDLTLASKWGMDLYHYAIYFDSEIEYDKNLFRSINYIRLEDLNDTYYMVHDIYDDTNITSLIQNIYLSSSNTNFR